jgi:hypothetical protein
VIKFESILGSSILHDLRVRITYQLKKKNTLHLSNSKLKKEEVNNVLPIMCYFILYVLLYHADNNFFLFQNIDNLFSGFMFSFVYSYKIIYYYFTITYLLVFT